ncbi:hypothetical protein [Azotobacter armeniacus]
MWDAILARFEKQAPASIMARLALERAIPAEWVDVDEVFEAHRASIRASRCSPRWSWLAAAT